MGVKLTKMSQTANEILAVYILVELFEFGSSWYNIRLNAAQLTNFQQVVYHRSIAISYALTILIGSFGLWAIDLLNVNIFEYVGLLFVMLWLRDAIDALITKGYMLMVYRRHERKLRKEALALNGQQQSSIAK